MSGSDTAMKWVDEFRDPALARQLLTQIATLAKPLAAARGRPLQIMEVCGGHTHAIFRFGLHQQITSDLEFVHGPGCPVCVLPMGRIDDALAIAAKPGVILTTFGDVMRVPGSGGNLLQARARGADVRMVYSPLDALALAQANPDKEVVFFAIGFETTMPATAFTLQRARGEGIANFSVVCNHITIAATVKAILDSPGTRLDGFIGPGHVCMVTGTGILQFIPQQYSLPVVISGFEPLDMLQSLLMVLQQMQRGISALENQYARVVADDGNAQAINAISDVFTLRDFFEWRGLDSIDHSGVRLSDHFAGFDAELKFELPNLSIADPKSCQCGEVLKGVIKPTACKVYGSGCTPQTPMGALMVSSEGACAAYYNYGIGRQVTESLAVEVE